MKSKQYLVLFTIMTLSVVAGVQSTASAQILTPNRCAGAAGVSDAQAQARYAWGVWCRANPEKDIYGNRFSADHYLNQASLDAYVAASDTLKPKLYPTFFDMTPMLSWNLPNDPGRNCVLLPTTAFNVGLCIAGCYAENTPLQFADGSMGIKAAAEAGKVDLVTLAPTSTLDSLQFVKNKVEHYTVDMREEWQTIYTLSMKSGGTLRVTNEHPLLTIDGVMHQAQGLKLGDELIRANGKPDPIVNIAIDKIFGKVYNVKPVTTDYVSNIVVAAGYLNGSVRYQNEFLDMINALILRRALTEQAAQFTGN